MYQRSLSHQIFYKILCPILLICLCLLQTAGHSAFANNGAIAYAYPVKGISIDGLLSDWPQDLVLYPIQRIELGDPFSDQKDLEAYFRVGYNLAQKAIYLAVEVFDQSAVFDTTSGATWNTQDGIELYLDAAHVKSGSGVIQYSRHGDHRPVSDQEGAWNSIEMKMLKTDFGRVYEWRINLDQAAEPGRSLGMDVVVIDKDEDDTFSWVAWGKHVHKMNNPDRCGDLVLLDADTKLAKVSGQVDFSNLATTMSTGKLRLSAIDNPKMWLQTAIDSTGHYSATVPVGGYNLEVPGALIRLDDKYYRIAPSDPITFTVNANQPNTPPPLAPRQIPRPDLLPAKGLLHNFDTDRKKALNHFVETYREYYDIPGVSLALIKDGRVIYHQTYGVKNILTNEPVNENTLFEAASVTKPVFAFVVLRLAEKGVIDLDKPLYEYLTFDALEAYPEYHKMTARHVLTHRSGLPNWGLELKNTPGTKYGYSGEGFEYLKRVVVKIMQKDIEQIIDEELINLLELYHMEFSDNEELRKVVSSGHVNNRPTEWPIPQQAGMAYSLHTESKAFSAFAIALLNRKGLQPDTYNKLMEIRTEIPTEYWKNENNREGFGLGIFIRESDHGNTFSHGGNNGDFKCLFEVYQDLKMGYVIFTNSNMGDVLAGDLANLLVEGAEPRE